jgi:NitT/TauT family transport system permease protein
MIISPDEVDLIGINPADVVREQSGPHPADRKDPFPISRVIAPVVVMGLVIGGWYMMHIWGLRYFFNKNGHVLIPTPVRVFSDTFLRPIARERYIAGLGWTSLTAYGGLAITIVVGMLLAILMSQAKWVESATYPYLVALQAIPILAVVPIIYAIFGGGLAPRFFVVIMISFFPIVTNTLFGLNSADPGQHDLFTLRNASRWTRLVKLQLPAAMPSIFTGFRISAGLSVIGAVVGEQFFQTGSKPGVGIVMNIYRTKGIYAPLWGGIIIACVIGIVTFLAFGLISKMVVGHWHESGRRTT